MAKSNRALEFLNAFPTTAATCVVVLAIIVATSVRYLFMQPALADFGGWLTFLGSALTIIGGTVVGKRWTSDPAVITAEAAARQDPPPDTFVDPAGGIDVRPQPGAVTGPADPGA